MITYLNEKRLQIIEKLLSESQEVCMAVSFIRNSGLRLIRPTYYKNDKYIKIVVDTKMNITEKIALRQLFDDNAQLKRYSKNNAYHPKVWLFRIDNIWKAVIGSMNMSLGALTTNIEYCLLVEGDDANPIKEWFFDLWKSDEVTKIDSAFIDAMPTISKSQSSPSTLEHTPKSPELEIESISNQNINDFINEWINDNEMLGQNKRKLGWRFRPAQGPINEKRLIRLKKFMNYMFKDNYFFKLTEAIAAKIPDTCKFPLSRSTHLTSPRGLLIRREINYLEKLGLIKKGSGTGWKTVLITSLGISFKKANNQELMIFAEKAIIQYQWFGIHIHDFICKVLALLPNKSINKAEMQLFVRHGGIDEYNYSTPEDITRLILTYRKMDENKKSWLWKYMEKNFNQTDASNSQTSLMNTAGHALDNIMKDLATSSQLEFSVNQELKLIG